MTAREAFEAYYRQRLPDADFSGPMWNVEWSIWQAAWNAAITASQPPPVITFPEDMEQQAALADAAEPDDTVDDKVPALK